MVHRFITAVEANNIQQVTAFLEDGVDVHMEMDRAVRYCTSSAILEVLAKYGANLLTFGFQPINTVSMEDVDRAEILYRYHPELLVCLSRSPKIADHFIKNHPDKIIEIISRTILPRHIYDSLISIGYADAEGWEILARRAGRLNDWGTFKKIPGRYRRRMTVDDVAGDARILTSLLTDRIITPSAALYEYVMQKGYTEFLSVLLNNHGYINFRPSNEALAGIVTKDHYPSICLYLFSAVTWKGWLSFREDSLVSLRMNRYGVCSDAVGPTAHWTRGMDRSAKGPWVLSRDLHMTPVPATMQYTDRLCDVSIICHGDEEARPWTFEEKRRALPDPLTVEMLMKAKYIIEKDADEIYKQMETTETVEASSSFKRKRDD